MVKKVFCLLMFSLLLIFGIINVNGLETYLGIKILNLTDSPSTSCAGQTGYGFQGRIRAISSIPPELPIYFELRKTSDDSLVWSGNSTENTDYTIGEIIYFPNTVNLSIGEEYKLFFDIDAIRLYLPLVDVSNFLARVDDNYWTAGFVGSGSSKEYQEYSNSNCLYAGNSSTYQLSSLFVSVERDASKLIHSCMNDSTDDNCDSLGIIGVPKSSYSIDFKINGQYTKLYQPNVGNFLMKFNFT